MWEILGLNKLGQNVSFLAVLARARVSSGRQRVTSEATTPIADLQLIPTLLPGETSDEKERSEREAEHHRDRAVVPLYPCPQGAEHARSSIRRGRVEADEHNHRDGEDHEHQPERHGAASVAKFCRSDQVHARYEDREVLDLDREERHPESKRPGRRHGLYRLYPSGWLRVWVGSAQEAPEAQDDEQTTDRHTDNPANQGGGIFRSAKEGEPRETHHRAGSEVAGREGGCVGQGPSGTHEQDGEEEQGRRDRAAGSQNEKPREQVAHERSARQSSGPSRLRLLNAA